MENNGIIELEEAELITQISGVNSGIILKGLAYATQTGDRVCICEWASSEENYLFGDAQDALIYLAEYCYDKDLPVFKNSSQITASIKDERLKEQIESLYTLDCSIKDMVKLSTYISSSSVPPQEKHDLVTASIDWQKPTLIKNRLLPVEPFNSDLLPEPLIDWIADISMRKNNAPIDYAAVTVMVVLGMLIGKKILIHPKKYDDWLVVVNLWGCIIGRPSMLKTPTLDDVLKSLKDLERESKKLYEEDLKHFTTEAKLNDLEKKDAEQKAGKAIKTGNRAEAERLLKEANESTPPTPTRKRYLVNDATIEKMGELLSENPNGLLINRDELSGFLSTMDRSDKAQDRAFYLEAWNGTGSFTYDRIGRGTIDIESSIVSLIGGIQPGKLLNYMKSMFDGSGDDGLIQRLQMMVFPDIGEFMHIDRRPDPEAKNRAYKIFTTLSEIPENDESKILHFSPEGQLIFDEWYSEFIPRLRDESCHHLEAHLSKYPSLMASLALIIHIIEDGVVDGVSGDAALKAIAWCEYLESHARRIYGLASDTPQGAITLLSKIKNLSNPFRVNDFNNKGWSGLKNASEIHPAITTLCELGYLHPVTEKTTTRPKTLYYINPDILED